MCQKLSSISFSFAGYIENYIFYHFSRFDLIFSMRGLVLDLDKGNFLKLAEDGRVLRFDAFISMKDVNYAPMALQIFMNI